MTLKIACISALFAFALQASAATRSFDSAHLVDGLALRAATLPADRRPTLVRDLEDLGPGAADALLARATTDSEAMKRLARTSPAAHRAFRAAILEVLGKLRDVRAVPILTTTFEAGGSDARIVRAAADALGRLCESAPTLPTLTGHVADPLEIQAISGLGQCRTTASTRALAGRLTSSPAEPVVVAIAQALGQVASSWAWQALGPTRAAEGLEVRRLASAAVVRAWPTASPEGRRALTKALLMVDDPGTLALLDANPAGLAPLRSTWTRAHRPAR